MPTGQPLTCTIIKAGRSDAYGIALVVGNTYSLDFNLVKSLYQSGYATVADITVFDDDFTPLGQTLAQLNQVQTALVSPTTGLPISLGGGSISAKSSTSVVGDSRFAYGFTTGSVGITGVRSMNPIMWMNDLLASQGVGFDFIAMWAQGGETLASSLGSGRWASFLADGAEIGHMIFMHNDLNPAGTADMTPQTFLDLYEARLIEAVAVKKVVYVWSGTPLVSSVSTTYLNQWYQFPAINAGLKALCAKYRNAIYVDAYNPILDTTSATLDAVTGMIQEDDGVHETTRGANKMGYAGALQTADKVNITRYKTKGSNILPAFTGTGGAKGTGTFTVTNPTNLPLNWEIIATAGVIGTTVTITQIDGGRVRLAMDNTANAADCTISIRPNSTARTAMLALLNSSGGDTLQAQFDYQMFGIGGIQGCNLGGYWQVNASTNYSGFMGGKSTQEDNTSLAWMIFGHGGKRKSTVLTIPAITVTAITFSVDITLPALTGVCTFDLWTPELYKLT